ncbi:hypothetical protein FSP39_005117 [Pinctada imbricata]|uniref:HECT-type E3 ubiquitin transferase n=1 Tax=Pinctada imbricata TaxID=66713 RepID=A0AA88YTJ4_PINIB|nr:hypothetical protein FSP39_005117 [Pinctada imbricata]
MRDETERSYTLKEENLEGNQITVGHGHFKAGKFSRISCTSLSLGGGIVVVGPFAKTGNTSDDIRKAAYKKFCQQNRNFKQLFKSHKKLYLVYPDGTLVEKLPDGKEVFSILGYRDFLDPKKRFDRLRLYLCSKQNYQAENGLIEIVTDSSSEDEQLPPLVLSHTRSEYMDNSSEELEESLILVKEVIFHYNGNEWKENFPNNTKGSVLASFIETTLKMSKGEFHLKVCDGGRDVMADDRLQDLADEEEGECNRLEELEKAIPANFCDQSADRTADIIAEATLEIMADVSEPVSILKEYREQFLQGRPLDVVSMAEAIEGDTSAIFISRNNLFEDAMEELKNLGNIRCPLEVSFYGEEAMDLGGPRKEFLAFLMQEIQDRFLVTHQGDVILQINEDAIGKHHFFYAGMAVGIGILQGADIPEHLLHVTTQPQQEHVRQFRSGLRRTGVLQLLESKPNIRHLFTQRKSINVTSLLHTFHTIFSEEGSNKRHKEEEAYRFFVKYVRDVYSGRRGNVTVERILKFATGSASFPVLGYGIAPTIEFVDTRYPTSSTCINKMYLPNEEMIAENYDMAFMNDYFGLE